MFKHRNSITTIDIQHNKLYSVDTCSGNALPVQCPSTGPDVIKLSSVVNSAEHEIYPADEC